MFPFKNLVFHWKFMSKDMSFQDSFGKIWYISDVSVYMHTYICIYPHTHSEMIITFKNLNTSVISLELYPLHYIISIAVM